MQPVLEDPITNWTGDGSAYARWQTISLVVFPQIAPALRHGFALAFARAVGEYRSVISSPAICPTVSEIRAAADHH